MFLYVVLAQNGRVQDTNAACQLIRSEFSAELSGIAPMNIGIVFATPKPVPAEYHATLGLIEFI